MAWDDNLEIWSWAASPSPCRTYTGARQIWEICSHWLPSIFFWLWPWLVRFLDGLLDAKTLRVTITDTQWSCGRRATCVPSYDTRAGSTRPGTNSNDTFIVYEWTWWFEASFSNFSGRASLSFLCPMLLYTFDFVCVQLAHIDIRGHS